MATDTNADTSTATSTDLAPIRTKLIWFARYGTNDIRVYFQTHGPENSPLQMTGRTFTPGSVRFFRLDGTELQYRAQKAKEDGWTFYLLGNMPTTEGVRMVARPGWVTGAEAIDQMVPNFNVNKIEP
jgi:hypothetical protein